MDIRVDDLEDAQVIELLKEHVAALHAVSPPGSRHVLDLEGLRRPEITFWTIWSGLQLAGCGALKELSATHGEVKSMRTASPFLRQGVASRMLQHIMSVAAARGYHQLSLETGSMDYFESARKLYARFGFKPCGPFADYKVDPNSVFMSRKL